MWDTRHCWYGYPYQVQCSNISHHASITVHVTVTFTWRLWHVFVSEENEARALPLYGWTHSRVTGDALSLPVYFGAYFSSYANGNAHTQTHIESCLTGTTVMQTSPQATEGFFHIVARSIEPTSVILWDGHFSLAKWMYLQNFVVWYP